MNDFELDRSNFLLNDEEVEVVGWSIYDIHDTWVSEHEDVPGYYLNFTDGIGNSTSLVISQKILQQMLSEIRTRIDDEPQDNVAYGSYLEDLWAESPITTTIVSGEHFYSVTEE